MGFKTLMPNFLSCFFSNKPWIGSIFFVSKDVLHLRYVLKLPHLHKIGNLSILEKDGESLLMHQMCLNLLQGKMLQSKRFGAIWNALICRILVRTPFLLQPFLRYCKFHWQLFGIAMNNWIKKHPRAFERRWDKECSCLNITDISIGSLLERSLGIWENGHYNCSRPLMVEERA